MKDPRYLSHAPEETDGTRDNVRNPGEPAHTQAQRPVTSTTMLVHISDGYIPHPSNKSEEMFQMSAPV